MLGLEITSNPGKIKGDILNGILYASQCTCIKKIITVLTCVQFSGKGRQSLHLRYIIKCPQMLISCIKLDLAFYLNKDGIQDVLLKSFFPSTMHSSTLQTYLNVHVYFVLPVVHESS